MQPTTPFRYLYHDLLVNIAREYRNYKYDPLDPIVNTEVNNRTGERIFIAEPVMQYFSIELGLSNTLPVPINRQYYPAVAAAEVAWQFLGAKDAEFINHYAPKLWDKFTDENGEIETAYGYRWQSHFGRNQLDAALEALKTDKTNRQIVISAWDPRSDGLGGPQPLNIPCPIGFVANVTKSNTLNAMVFIRSSDVLVGLPYDVMSYALTLDAMAASLGLKLGHIGFSLAHAHAYEKQSVILDKILEDDYEDWCEYAEADDKAVEPQLPGWSVEDIRNDPHGYVKVVRDLCKNLSKIDFNPKVAVVV